MALEAERLAAEVGSLLFYSFKPNPLRGSAYPGRDEESIVKKNILIVALSFLSFDAIAATACGKLSIRGLTVQAERESGSGYANTMRVLVDHGECGGVKYAYLKNSQSSYSGVFAMILSAQASGSKINIWVKDTPGIYSDAREIEWVSF